MAAKHIEARLVETGAATWSEQPDSDVDKPSQVDDSALQCAVCICMLAVLREAQQIGSVDLTRPPKASKRSGSQEKSTLPNGCEKISDGIIADGWVKSENDQPQDIVVKVIRARDMKPALGSELEAQVELQNNDQRPIQIPWATDFGLIKSGQDPAHLDWEGGTFEFMLRGSHGTQIRLKSLTSWLYGFRFSAGSLLTIPPEKSITALVKLKIEDEYAIPPERLKEGEWQLLAEWHQVGRSWNIKNCKASNAYFQYSDFYRQHNLPVTIQVTAPGSSALR
jgi:hypothetical protein